MKKKRHLSRREKLNIIEKYGTPTYLYAESELLVVDSGGQQIPDTFALLPGQAAAEIEQVYKEEYEYVKGPERLQILKRFFGNFPHLAFRPVSWSWIIWQKSLASKTSDREAKKTLNSIAQAVSRGNVFRRRFKTHSLFAAKFVLKTLLDNENIRYHESIWRECVIDYRKGAISRQQYFRGEREHLLPILEFLQQVNPSRINSTELETIKKKLMSKHFRAAAELVVHKVFNVRLTDIQLK